MSTQSFTLTDAYGSAPLDAFTLVPKALSQLIADPDSFLIMERTGSSMDYIQCCMLSASRYTAEMRVTHSGGYTHYRRDNLGLNELTQLFQDYFDGHISRSGWQDVTEEFR